MVDRKLAALLEHRTQAGDIDAFDDDGMREALARETHVIASAGARRRRPAARRRLRGPLTDARLSAVEFRAIEPEELDAFLVSLSNAFSEVEPDEEEVRSDKRRLEPDRCFAAFDEGRIVGCAGAFSLRTTVPGGAAAGTAGITTVGVLPTHRRQGITRELMGRLLEQAHEREEPLASLVRVAGRDLRAVRVRRRDDRCSISTSWWSAHRFVPSYEPHGRTRLLDRAEALPRMHRVYEAWWPCDRG